MWNYPYLVATFCSLQKQLLNYGPASYQKDQDALFAASTLDNGRQFLYPTSSIKDEWAATVARSYKWSITVLELSGYRNPIKPTLEDWTKQYLLLKAIEDSIDSCSYKGGIVYYKVKGVPYKIEVDIVNPLHDYKKLAAIKALREGYDVKEVRGSHFEIRAPGSKTTATSLYSCSCQEYEVNRVCTHLYLAQSLVEQRSTYVPYY